MKFFKLVVFYSIVVFLSACSIFHHHTVKSDHCSLSSGTYFCQGKNDQVLVIKSKQNYCHGDFVLYKHVSDYEMRDDNAEVYSCGTYSNNGSSFVVLKQEEQKDWLDVHNSSSRLNDANYKETDSLLLKSTIDTFDFSKSTLIAQVLTDTVCEFEIDSSQYYKYFAKKDTNSLLSSIFDYSVYQKYPNAATLDSSILPYASFKIHHMSAESFFEDRYFWFEDQDSIISSEVERQDYHIDLSNYLARSYSRPFDYDLVYVNADGTLYWQGCIWKKQ